MALTMAAESAPRERTASAIGFVQTAQRLGPAVGPAVGGVLAGLVGLRLSFVVAAVFYVGALVLVLRLYEELPTPAWETPRTGEEQTIGYRGVLSIEHVPLLMAIIFVVTFVDRSVGPVLALYLEQLGVATDRVPVVAGWLFSLTAVAGAVGHHACSHLMQRFAAGVVIATAGAIVAVGALIYAAGIGPWPMAIAAAAVGLGSGLATTAAYASAGHTIPHSARGAGFGMLTGASLVGLAASPVVAGVLGSTTFRGVFLVDVLMVAAMVYVVRHRMTARAEAT
jgi:MFS family permease